MPENQARYERQILMPQIGQEGQAKLAAARVVVVGAGGLGSPVLQYLAAAGVGRLTVIDGDVVSASNLNRQLLYTPADIGQPKALAAEQVLARLNPAVQVTALAQMLDEQNATSLLAGHDLAMLCLDNMAARRMVNRAAVALGLPCVEGAVEGLHGKLMLILPGQGPCYECLHGQAKPRKGPLPVLGAMAGMVGCMMAVMAVQQLVGMAPTPGVLMLIDGRHFEVEHIPVQRSPECTVCGEGRA